MSTQQDQQDKPLPTIWRVPDDLWSKIESVLLQLDPPAKTGRSRIGEEKLGNDLTTFVLATVIALLLALVTVGYQSVKAARLNPADALRYE